MERACSGVVEHNLLWLEGGRRVVTHEPKVSISAVLEHLQGRDVNAPTPWPLLSRLLHWKKEICSVQVIAQVLLGHVTDVG